MSLSKPRGGNKSELMVRYKDEMVKMRSKGFSYPQIVSWLGENGVCVSVSSVSRFIRDAVNHM